MSEIRVFGSLLALLSAGLILGAALRFQPVSGSNDGSRWNTVWSLTHGKGYNIDQAPYATVDKVKRDGHYYSSKPALMPTVVAAIAGLLKDLKGWTIPEHAAVVNRIVLLLVNVLPLAAMVIFYGFYLQRTGVNLVTALFCLTVAGFGTYLTAYSTTLNNHTQAAWAAFFTLYNLLRIKNDGKREWYYFALCGAFTSWTVANELVAIVFALLVTILLYRVDVRRTLLYFVPIASVIGGAFLYTMVDSTGGFLPYYLYFDSLYYQHEESYWRDPSGIDAADEPKLIYLFHLLLGHHGVFSLTPVFLISLIGMVRFWRTDWLHGSALGLSVVMISFYTFWTKNYGGVCQGPRWLFWLIPFWLFSLVPIVTQYLPGLRFRAFAWTALFVSVMSVGYALGGDSRSFEPPGPWSTSWLHLGMRRAGWVGY